MNAKKVLAQIIERVFPTKKEQMYDERYAMQVMLDKCREKRMANKSVSTIDFDLHPALGAYKRGRYDSCVVYASAA